MQQTQCCFEETDKVHAGNARFVRIFGEQPRLHQFQIPVAELAPEEIVNSVRRFVETVGLQLGGDFFGNSGEAGENPAVFESCGRESGNADGCGLWRRKNGA